MKLRDIEIILREMAEQVAIRLRIPQALGFGFIRLMNIALINSVSMKPQTKTSLTLELSLAGLDCWLPIP